MITLSCEYVVESLGMDWEKWLDWLKSLDRE